MLLRAKFTVETRGKATLTSRQILCGMQDAHAKKLVTSEFSKTMEWKQSPRPCYDMVEEYNRSLDEYKDKVRGPCTFTTKGYDEKTETDSTKVCCACKPRAFMLRFFPPSTPRRKKDGSKIEADPRASDYGLFLFHVSFFLD